ncbi:MAG: FMN-binding protein [Streptosporangiaceae bacterium]
MTGPVAHTDYGGVQVRVSVSRGRIVSVTAVTLPHGNQMDLRLSKPAARTLERQVIDSQSAEVDMVSGATYTSRGYLRSLQSALDRLS